MLFLHVSCAPSGSKHVLRCMKVVRCQPMVMGSVRPACSRRARSDEPDPQLRAGLSRCYGTGSRADAASTRDDQLPRYSWRGSRYGIGAAGGLT
jgi:hypothetical protein